MDFPRLAMERAMTTSAELWQRYCDVYCADRNLGFSLDTSRVRMDDAYFKSMAPAMERAFAAMQALEKGAIANADEQRMVGHYWLRDASLAPTSAIADEIRGNLAAVRTFADQIHQKKIAGSGGPFTNVVHIGIGGSALGPELIAQALASANPPLQIHFIDNTDPRGIDETLAALESELGRTLVVVVSKSGGTPETRNGMLEAAAAYQRAGLDFARHAAAITQQGSQLDKKAVAEKWLARFPMWDWVGGRTSVMSAVGLVPAALQGIDVEAFLAGAAAMDVLTRRTDVKQNPAALMALAWYKLGDGRGKKDMVILPYKDRLALFSRYLQQLVMESLGKALDRKGEVVHQGIAVYGNKGSTDQHAYVQQLRDGVPNFFVTFIQVLHDRQGPSIEVEPGVTSGDFLCGFLQGTRRALYENGRDSITITINEVTPKSVGALVALYERAVGLYAELIDINAYHQPGVEAGKKAAAAILDLQHKVVAALRAAGQARTAGQLAAAIGQPDEAEAVFKILEHLAANPGRGVSTQPGARPSETTFQVSNN
jgi:glucose-6-phosphate isomerase